METRTTPPEHRPAGMHHRRAAGRSYGGVRQKVDAWISAFLAPVGADLQDTGARLKHRSSTTKAPTSAQTKRRLAIKHLRAAAFRLRIPGHLLHRTRAGSGLRQGVDWITRREEPWHQGLAGWERRINQGGGNAGDEIVLADEQAFPSETDRNKRNRKPRR